MKTTRNRILIALVALSLAATAWAQTDAATRPARKKKAVVKTAEPAVTAADVQSLKDALAAQQQQIQQLTQQLQQNANAWQQAQQQLQQAQTSASDAQQKAASLQATEDQQSSTVAKLSTDVADVRTTVTNNITTGQEEQKRLSGLETAFGRFRFSGDMRVRGENFTQEAIPDRNRARVRARFGVDGQLNEDFMAGIYLASGTLGDPTTTNETLTNFFDRKTVGLDRAYITYNPVAHNWLSLTGGKFATPWQRTSLTFDPDISPEGFDAKVSFDLHNAGPVKNFTAQAMQLLINESTKGPDSYATGGQVSAKLNLGIWTAIPSYTLLNWHLPDAILQATAFAVQATTGGSTSTTGGIITTTGTGQLPGEGPGCAAILGYPSVAPCAFAANGMTNGTFVTTNAAGTVLTPHFWSGFLYSDFILNNQFKTGVARLPLNLMLEYEDNLNARADPLNTKGVGTGLGRQSNAYGADLSFGQAKNKNDVQFGYSWWRIEQDAIIASFAESDQRAPTNILQNRVYAMWKLKQNVLAQYTMWIGRTLNTGLENNAATVNKTITTAGTKEPDLKRSQFDLVYTF
jgi:flagellar biosynthesis chaperone FliJ